jgi:voltage-gated sodium channel
MAKVHPQQEETMVVESVGSHDALTEDKAHERHGTDRSSVSAVTQQRSKRTGLFDFANAEQIKEKVRENQIKKVKCDVTRWYHTTGIFQKIARHRWFENITLGVISANAIWIGVDTDHNKKNDFFSAEAIFILADCMFFTYFSMELFIRFMSFRVKKNCLRDPWFLFDSTLVGLYFLDPFVLAVLNKVTGGRGMAVPTAILRLFRLARLSRLIRMLRALPELMILVKGISTATASVGYTMGLLCMAAYIFAIALTNLSDGYEFRELYFSSVPHAMYSLFIYGGFLDDLAAFGDPIRAESTVCLIIVTIYIIIASMTLMNMLIGLLCEVIDAVAMQERETMLREKVYEKMAEVYRLIDQNGDGNGMVSWSEFQDMLSKPAISAKAIRALESVQVDVESMIDVAEEYFFYMGNPVELTFHEFMDMVLELRGGQNAMVKDVLLLGKRFTKKFQDLKTRLDKFNKRLDDLETVW